MPGPLKVNDAIALAATMCARDALRALHAALPPNLRPGGHCYALSEATARLLRRLDFTDVRCVVGHADATDWLHEAYPNAAHAWLEDGSGWRFDPKSAAARVVYGAQAPVYSEYREAVGTYADRLREGFLNGCGLADETFDVVVDACERVTRASVAA